LRNISHIAGDFFNKVLFLEIPINDVDVNQRQFFLLSKMALATAAAAASGESMEFEITFLRIGRLRNVCFANWQNMAVLFR